MKKKELVHIGTFGQAQGLKGDIKINIFTSSFESFKIINNFFIENEKSSLVFKNIKKIGNKIICSIKNCNDRDAALLYKGKHIFSLRENFPPTTENEYYVVDLIGCKVLDYNNIEIGKVENIENFGAGDLIEISCPNKNNFYVPMNNDNLVKVDIISKLIIVNPIDGILE